MRNFGIPNVQASLRGGEHPPAHYAPDTQRDLNSFSLSTRSILERGDISQSLIDGLLVVLAFTLFVGPLMAVMLLFF